MDSRRTLLVAAFGAALAFVDATVVNVAFPSIRASFSSSYDWLSWVLNAYNILFAALLLPAGRIGDLVGRRRLFLGGVVIFTLGSAGCAAAPSLGVLIGMRALQAVGAASVVPGSMALVLQAHRPAERSHAIALWSGIAALGAGLGPSLGGLLVHLDDWRLAFLVNVPLGAVVLLLGVRCLHESRAEPRPPRQGLGVSVVAALAIGLLTLAIVEAPDWGWTDARTLGVAAASSWLGSRVLKRRAAVIDPAVLAAPNAVTANVLTVIGAAGFYGYILCNVLFLTTIWGYSVLTAGLALTPGPFVAAAIAGLAGRAADRLGAGPVICAGAVVWAAGMAFLVTQLGSTPDFVGRWLPAMGLLGVGAGCCFPIISAAAVADATPSTFATATGLTSVARQLGAVLGIAILVDLIGRPTTLAGAADAFDRGWTFAGGCFAVVALLAVLLRRAPDPLLAAAHEMELVDLLPRRRCTGAPREPVHAWPALESFDVPPGAPRARRDRAPEPLAGV